MNILHYSLGFPPFRSGGLTKFCIDLMNQQLKTGNRVSMIWPGKIQIIKKTTKIEKKETDGIINFEIINPNIVPYDEGVKKVKYFINDGDYKVFDCFFKENKFDIIHIHTFMGIQKNLIIAAKKNNVKIVFTTHDYYPICPKVKMFFNGKKCEYAHSFNYCLSCNKSGLSIWKLMFLQSHIYMYYKSNNLFNYFREIHRKRYFKIKYDSSTVNEDRMEEYRNLRMYYKKIFDEVDVVHYNSNISKKIYDEFFGEHVGSILNISHRNIMDRRKLFKPHKDLRITYLGPQNTEKGYYLLKSALDIVSRKRKISLNVFFTPIKEEKYMVVHKAYKYDDLEMIFNDSDLVIVPSLWNETYGFNVLEALSFGIPVIVSEYVGAKDIIPIGGGIIVEKDSLNPKDLANVILKINQDDIRMMNQIICNDAEIITMKSVSGLIMQKIYERVMKVAG